MTIFDLGSCAGEWTDSNYKQTDQFILVDANPHVYDLCVKRFEEKPNVRVLNYLIADKDFEKRDFYISMASVGEVSTASGEWIHQSRHRFSTTWDVPIEVDTVTIDLLIKTYGKPGLIKIDVEGYELEALNGLSKKVPLLCFEYCEELKEQAINCLERCFEIGFRHFFIQHGDSYTFRPKSFKTAEIALKEINTFIPERRQRWGQIWCK